MRKSAIKAKKSKAKKVDSAADDKAIQDRLINEFGGDFLCADGKDGYHHEVNVWVEDGDVAIRMPGLTEQQARRVLQILSDNISELMEAGAANYDPGIVEY